MKMFSIMKLKISNLFWQWQAFIGNLLCVEYYAKWLTSIISFNPQHPETGTTFIVKVTGSERLSNLSMLYSY